MNRFFKLFSLVFLALLFSFTSINNKKLIVIDAGHGGNDLGVNRTGINEKDIVLDIAKKVQKLNKNENIEIVLTRDSDTYTALTGRVEFINKLKPTMVISLHVNNSTNAETKGNLIFAKPAAFDLAAQLATKFGNCKVEDQNLHLLRNSEAPTMLLELGYMSNIEDRNYLNSEEGKNEVSTKILNFINEH